MWDESHTFFPEPGANCNNRGIRQHSSRKVLSCKRRIDHGESLHEAQAEYEVIDQHDSVAEGNPLQATLRERKLLMGSQQPSPTPVRPIFSCRNHVVPLVRAMASQGFASCPPCCRWHRSRAHPGANTRRQGVRALRHVARDNQHRHYAPRLPAESLSSDPSNATP